jgi:hypothetical protein
VSGPRPGPAPRFSLVVAYSLRQGKPEALLAGLANLPGPSRELIPVPYGPPGKAMESSPPGTDHSGQARTQGLGGARGRVVVFLEPDCSVPPDLLARLEDGLSRPEVAGMGGAWQAWDPGNPAASISQAEFEFETRELEQHDFPVLFAFCAAFKRERLMITGGPEPREGEGGGALASLCRRLAARGDCLVFDPGLKVRRRQPDTWGGVAREQFRRGWEVFASRRQRSQDPGPPSALPRGMAAQVALALAAPGFILALASRAPENAFTLSALCLLLLYPLNRPFLKYVAAKHPPVLNRAIILCLARPFLWCAGLVTAALDRVAKGA